MAGFQGSGVGQAGGGTLRGEEGQEEACAVSRGDQRVGPGGVARLQWDPPRYAHGDLSGDAGWVGVPAGAPWGHMRIPQLSVFRGCSQPHLLTVASHTPCF